MSRVRQILPPGGKTSSRRWRSRVRADADASSTAITVESMNSQAVRSTSTLPSSGSSVWSSSSLVARSCSPIEPHPRHEQRFVGRVKLDLDGAGRRMLILRDVRPLSLGGARRLALVQRPVSQCNQVDQRSCHRPTSDATRPRRSRQHDRCPLGFSRGRHAVLPLTQFRARFAVPRIDPWERARVRSRPRRLRGRRAGSRRQLPTRTFRARPGGRSELMFTSWRLGETGLEVCGTGQTAAIPVESPGGEHPSRFTRQRGLTPEAASEGWPVCGRPSPCAPEGS